MYKILNTQYSIFCENRIETNKENIDSIIEKLNNNNHYDFLPNIISSQELNVVTGEMSMNRNLSFVSKDNTINMVFYNNRIDLFINNEISNYDDLFDFCKNIYSYIIHNYEIKISRIAYNISCVKNGICNKTDLNNHNTLDYYNDLVLKEWSSRVNVEKIISVNDKKESINVICELGNTINRKTNEEGTMCHLDINTTEKNATERFGETDVVKFFYEVLRIKNEMLESFDRY